MPHLFVDLKSAVDLDRIETFENLVLNGTDVNVRNERNRTILHELCFGTRIPDKALPFIRIIVCKGIDVNLKDDDNLTAIQLAAVECNRPVVEYLSSLPAVSPHSKISAFQVLGAQICTKEATMTYWTTSLLLKAECFNNDDMFDDNTLFPDLKIVSSIGDVKEIAGDLETRYQMSIVFLDRYLGRHNLHTLKSIRHLVFLYDRYGRSDAVSSAYVTMNNLLCKVLEVKQPLYIKQRSFSTFYDIIRFWLILFENGSNICYSDVGNIFTLAVYQLELLGEYLKENGIGYSQSEQALDLICNIFALAFQCEKSAVESNMFNETVKYLVEVDQKYNVNFGLSIIHLSVKKFKHTILPQDKNCTREMLNLLLKHGLSVNTLDKYRNTPLHYLLSEKVDNIQTDDVVWLLLRDSDVHLDIRNQSGHTVFDLLKQHGIEINEVDYRSLQCLAACCIKQHNIQYKDKHVPSRIQSFIDLH